MKRKKDNPQEDKICEYDNHMYCMLKHCFIGLYEKCKKCKDFKPKTTPF